MHCPAQPWPVLCPPHSSLWQCPSPGCPQELWLAALCCSLLHQSISLLIFTSASSFLHFIPNLPGFQPVPAWLLLFMYICCQPSASFTLPFALLLWPFMMFVLHQGSFPFYPRDDYSPMHGFYCLPLSGVFLRVTGVSGATGCVWQLRHRAGLDVLCWWILPISWWISLCRPLS